MLISLLLTSSALAAPSVTISATLQPDGRTIVGRLTATELGDAVWVDPLSGLPLPTDDLWQPRTFPGATQTGSVVFEELDGSLTFTTTLPRRYGDIGVGPDGTFANGAWYPQPLLDGHLPLVDWVVTLQGPPSWTLVVGGSVATGTVSWTGDGERASMAAIDGAHLLQLRPDITLVSKHRPRRAAVSALQASLGTLPHDGGVIVEATLLRRLARGGVGMSYLSDRAWRTASPARSLHTVGATASLLTGLIDEPDPYRRGLIAALRMTRHADALRSWTGEDLVRWGGWLPIVDSIHYDRRTPYIAEILEEVHTGDPLADDLVEVWDAHVSAAAVIAEAALTLDAAQLLALENALLAGVPTARLAEGSALPHDFFTARRVPPQAQDLTLSVGDTTNVTRVTSPAAPPQRVAVRVGEDTQLLDFPAGATTLPLEHPKGAPVLLDPDHLVQQTSRYRDAWPPRTTLTARPYLAQVNLTEGWVSASASLGLRQTYDTHNRYGATLYTGRDTRAGAALTYARLFGDPTDALRRTARAGLELDAAWLNPSFADADGPVAVGVGASIRVDDRISWVFPTAGGRAGMSGALGWLPGAASPWSRLTASATRLVSPHPRIVFAANAVGGLATGDVPHRLLALGGNGALRSLPANVAVGTRLGVGRAELRAQVMRARSVRLPLMWLTDVDLTLGSEVGWLETSDGPASAAGLTAGTSLTADWFGISPGTAAFTLGWPIHAEGVALASVAPFGLDAPRWPEVYLRWSQAY